MSSKKRAWWPAMPSGTQHQRPEAPQQDPRTAAYWKCVQQDLSQAMPWALPEHMQAQRTSPTPQVLSPQPTHTGHKAETVSSRQSLHEGDKQTGEHESLLYGNGNSSASCMLDQAAQPEAASAPHYMHRESAVQQHVVYAALFLSSEQQRVLLDRQATHGVCLAKLAVQPMADRSRVVAEVNAVNVHICMQGAGLLLQCQE